MIKVTDKKICILSHVVPPSPSGQAVMLYRLFEGVSADSYCLITASHNGGNATHALPGTCWQLRKPIILWWERLAEKSGRFAIKLAIWQAKRRARQITEIIQREDVKLFLACSGDLLDIPAGAIAAKSMGVPFIPYFFDDYIFQWTGWRRKVAYILEQAAMADATAAIVPNEFLQEEYGRRYRTSCKVIHNPVKLPDLDSLDAGQFPVEAGASIVYTGAIYHAHYDAFRNLIVALEHLNIPGLKLHIYTAQPSAELEANGICGSTVVRHPHVPQEEVPCIQRNADILFLPLAFVSTIPEVIRTSAPGKLGEYLAAGKPILAHTPPDSYVGWYVNRHQCGVVVDRNDPQELVKAIQQLLADDAVRKEMGFRARRQAEQDFDIRTVQQQFLDVVQKCVAKEI